MKKILLILATLMLLIPVMGGQTQISTFSEAKGIQIQYPYFDTFKFNTTIELFFHIYNVTTGLPLTNASTNCTIHMYNTSGSHILNTKLTWENTYEEWEYDGNVPTQYIGPVSYLVWCQGMGNIGGFIENGFEVTLSGKKQSTDYASLVLLLLTYVLIYGFMISDRRVWVWQLIGVGLLLGLAGLAYMITGGMIALTLMFITIIIAVKELVVPLMGEFHS